MMANELRRVVITGVGAVTPLGNDSQTSWKNMVAGKSGVGAITLFDASGYATRIAAEVRDFPFDDLRQKHSDLKDASRNTWLALKAAEEAYAASGLDQATLNRERFGIYLGAGDNGHDFPGFVKSIEYAATQDSFDGRKFSDFCFRNSPATIGNAQPLAG